jgi:hypothetical protein
MKHVKFLSLTILLTLFLFACSENNNNKTSSSGDKETDPPSTATSSAGNANWSAVIDGQPVSGGLIDDGLQQTNGYQSNVAYIVDVDQGKELLFYLSDPKNKNSRGVHSLRFAVPDKTGSSSFGPDEDGWGIEVDIVVNKDHTARYNSDSFTINTTSLSAAGVSGTFSGKFSLNGNITDTDKKAIEVTDGKFDIPMKQ